MFRDMYNICRCGDVCCVDEDSVENFGDEGTAVRDGAMGVV